MRSRLALLSLVLACLFFLTPLFSYAQFNTVAANNATEEYSEQLPPEDTPQDPDDPESEESGQPPYETPDEPYEPEEPGQDSQPPEEDDELVLDTPYTGDYEDELYEEDELEEEEEDEPEHTAIWDDEIFQVTLPTSLNLDFIIDPQGIFFLSNEDIAALDADPDSDRLGRTIDGVFQPLPTAGQIIFPNLTASHIENNGNLPILLEMDISLEITGEHSEIIVVNYPEEVYQGGEDQHRMFIGASFTSPNLHASTHFASNYLINAGIVPVLDTGQTYQFILDGAIPLQYTVINPDYEIVHVGVADGFGTFNNMQFTLAGKCNPTADWSILGEATSIRISLVFRIASTA